MKNKASFSCLMFAVLLGVSIMYTAPPAHGKSQPGERTERMRTGWVYYTDDQSITVDDMQFWFSPQTQYFKRDGTVTDRSYFSKGRYVGLRFEGKKVLTEMRELTPITDDLPVPSTPTGATQPVGATPDDSGMYLEDGVWKN